MKSTDDGLSHCEQFFSDVGIEISTKPLTRSMSLKTHSLPTKRAVPSGWGMSKFTAAILSCGGRIGTMAEIENRII